MACLARFEVAAAVETCVASVSLMVRIVEAFGGPSFYGDGRVRTADRGSEIVTDDTVPG